MRRTTLPDLDPDQWRAVAESMAEVRAATCRFGPRDPAEFHDAAMDGMMRTVRKMETSHPDFVRFARFNMRQRMIDRARYRKCRKLDDHFSIGHGPISDRDTDLLEPDRPFPFVEEESFEAILGKLDDPRQREYLRLRYRDGLTGVETSARLGVGYRHGKRIERNALRTLYHALGGRGTRPRRRYVRKAVEAVS